ncbi:cytochrome P450 CYP82D47-like [Aristolochia californica]|uniref:cytochrome P450 CYP82D47-like n=1 Tax=Aristolochia californica TaxID=171875 RepID=UPI0035DFCBE5
MEMGMVLLQQALVGLLALLLAFSLWKSWSSGRKAGAVSAPPEVPGRWPIIGHLHKLIDNQLPLARTLGALADKYGPLVTIWIGVNRAVVVSSLEMAKECYTTSDKALASRPQSVASKYLCYNYAMFGFTQNGPYWRDIRKMANVELLSDQRLEGLQHVRAREVDLSIKDLYKQWKENKKAAVKVEMKAWFGDLTFNNVVMIVAGKRYFGTNVSKHDESQATKFHQVIIDFFAQSGNPTPSDAVPVLEWFDIGGHISAMKKTFKDLDSICSAWLKEHRLRRLSGKHGPDEDFLDVMLTVLDKSHFADYDTDTVIKATCLTMILAGTDSNSVTLAWALSLLLNNRQELKKVQEELDDRVGKDRKVKESDIKNLPYLRAIVKETLRLHPPGPLAAPHEAMEDCSIGGYRIPAGTRVFLNLWKIQRDPRVWPDPLEFMPERYVTTNAEVDVKGQHFELIPFGSGRRMCPGVTFALQVLHLTLARLLQGFDVETPFEEPVDMTETTGLTNRKATPLQVLLSPRLSENLYM